MPNRYKCSNGETVTQSVINSRRSEAYKREYEGGPHPVCRGCGAKATESSHIISQQRCKEIHKTELIWDKRNFFPSCRTCHMLWETDNAADLYCYEYCMGFLKENDPEGYNKRIYL